MNSLQQIRRSLFFPLSVSFADTSPPQEGERKERGNGFSHGQNHLGISSPLLFGGEVAAKPTEKGSFSGYDFWGVSL
jgi:hypothetical protein